MTERADHCGEVVRILMDYPSVATVGLAELILDKLEALGWATPEQVRMMVAAAGGQIHVPADIQTDPPPELVIWRNALTGVVSLQTKTPAS